MQATRSRYAPEVSFPPYAFLPGRDPHPTRDSRGHSHGARESRPRKVEPSEWRRSTEYLLGVDLYNHGYLWEAHEAWEAVWHASKADPTQADFLQGLIQCAAACLKVPMGQPAGLERLCALGTGRLEAVARREGGSYMGLPRILEFVEAMRRFAGSQPRSVAGRPALELDVPGVLPPRETSMPEPPAGAQPRA